MKPFALCLAALLLGGCSSEPTSDDFRAFADTVTDDFREPLVDGEYTSTFDVELSRYNLERTDSLTAPLQGTVVWSVDSQTVETATGRKCHPRATKLSARMDGSTDSGGRWTSGTLVMFAFSMSCLSLADPFPAAPLVRLHP